MSQLTIHAINQEDEKVPYAPKGNKKPKKNPVSDPSRVGDVQEFRALIASDDSPVQEFVDKDAVRQLIALDVAKISYEKSHLCTLTRLDPTKFEVVNFDLWENEREHTAPQDWIRDHFKVDKIRQSMIDKYNNKLCLMPASFLSILMGGIDKLVSVSLLFLF